MIGLNENLDFFQPQKHLENVIRLNGTSNVAVLSLCDLGVTVLSSYITHLLVTRTCTLLSGYL